MSYINVLQKFQTKYKFVPRAALIQEYLRIADRADAEGDCRLWACAFTHAMRLGYDINS